jgi:hypothetical protein
MRRKKIDLGEIGQNSNRTCLRIEEESGKAREENERTELCQRDDQRAMAIRKKKKLIERKGNLKGD